MPLYKGCFRLLWTNECVCNRFQGRKEKLSMSVMPCPGCQIIGYYTRIWLRTEALYGKKMTFAERVPIYGCPDLYQRDSLRTLRNALNQLKKSRGWT